MVDDTPENNKNDESLNPSPFSTSLILGNAMQGLDFSKYVPNSALENIQAITSSFARAASIVSPAQQLLANLQVPAMEAVRAIGNTVAKLNIESMTKIAETLGSVQTSVAFLECCDKTGWPVYFIVDSEDEKHFAELNRNIKEESELRVAVTDSVFSIIDSGVLSSLRLRWEQDGDIRQGQKELMLAALDRYAKQDYLCTTAVLMCLFEGLIEQYCETLKALSQVSSEDLAEMKEWFGVGSSGNRIRNPGAKDKFVALLLLPERGILYWKSAGDYILHTTLASGDISSDLYETNPLRNKICHGDQTHYDSQIHALKAILCIDLVVLLNQAGLKVLKDVNENMEG